MKEEWKYTNINKFQSIKYQQSSPNNNNLKIIKSKANKILITNGEISKVEHSKEISSEISSDISEIPKVVQNSIPPNRQKNAFQSTET